LDLPVFKNGYHQFSISSSTPKYSIIGNVSDLRVSSEKPVYHLVKRDPYFVIVPKTGELILIDPPKEDYELRLYAKDVSSGQVSEPVSVLINLQKQSFFENELHQKEKYFFQDETNHDLNFLSSGFLLRSKRSIRPTKSYEFKESDAVTPGIIMFSLDKKHSSEVFKLESPNRWVTVDTSGTVRVKESWDYEQLGKDKTIDFWVLVTGSNLNNPERQRIIIHIRDVNDEPPYFINRPLPLQAVVQLNAAAGTSVFKLQARDPDTDHNIHYFLVRDRSKLP